MNYPKLRPIERVQTPVGSDAVLSFRDPTGLATAVLSLSAPLAYAVSLMDGTHSREDIQARFMLRLGRMLFSDELDQLIAQLDEACFLEGARADRARAVRRESYRAMPHRALRNAGSLAGDNGPLEPLLDRLLAPGNVRREPVVGLVAPHLDYPRGEPCYRSAYAGLAERTAARRFVILGTNHFGESAAVVGTRKDFETPWGVVRHDADFMRALDAALGHDLCELETDHIREHSVELQVVLLRRALGDRPFVIVPYLCPDPCGPTGTRPRQGDGPDLRQFAEALGRLIASDPTPTFIVAGADLSHVGPYFSDDHPLDADGLAKLRDSDLAALRPLESGDAEGFRTAVAATGNATNICSVGCIYAAAVALAGRARAVRRNYHQAVTRELGNCVTCAAFDFIPV